MAINPNEDTEFNDALRKHGILPPLEPTPSSPSTPPSPTFDDLLNDYTPAELQELADDAPDEDAERAISAYRRRLLADDRQEMRRARFGHVYPIGREDYTREVTEASKVNEAEDDQQRGTGVVCLLYKDGLPRSDRTFGHVRTLAFKYPRTKFVSIVGEKCIPNLPDGRVPMIIIYRKGEIVNQVVAWGADRERRIEELEAVLLVAGGLDVPEHRRTEDRRDDSDESDEDEGDSSSRLRPSAGKTRRNIRIAAQKDNDSDFEFDL